MTYADLIELADYHEKQAGYFTRVGDAIRDGTIADRHRASGAWHNRHAITLRASAKATLSRAHAELPATSNTPGDDANAT